MASSEQERAWKNAIVRQFKILWRNLPEGAEKNREKSVRIVNVRPRFEMGTVRLLEPCCSVYTGRVFSFLNF
jgi:hypothetical protein